MGISKQILLCKIKKVRIPVVVSLHVTNKCNLRCSYCYSNIDGRFDAKVPELSFQEITDCIDALHKLGTRWIVLLGGEPLLRRDIGAIIRHVKRKGMLCDLVTNGILIKSRIKDIAPIDLLCISLDGDALANDAARGKGSYQKIVEGLDIASARRIRTRIHAVLTKYNCNSRSIIHLAYLARKYHASFGYSSPIGQNRHVLDLVAPRDQETMFWKSVLRGKKKGLRVYNTVPALERLINWHYTDDRLKKARGDEERCFAGQRFSYIDSEGYLYPCICKGVKNGLNVKEVGVEKAWNSLAGLNCKQCPCIQYIEANEILDLKPQSIMLGLKTFFT